MLITKRGEKPHNYKKFKCPACGTELIADADDGDCAILNGIEYTSCPVCGLTLWYNRHGQGSISTEEYNKIKSQYEQME